MSAVGGEAENMCSALVFRLLTQKRHRRSAATSKVRPVMAGCCRLSFVARYLGSVFPERLITFAGKYF